MNFIDLKNLKINFYLVKIQNKYNGAIRLLIGLYDVKLNSFY